MASFIGSAEGFVVKVVVEDDDWRDFAELVDGLQQETVVVDIQGGDRLRFNTKRERSAWVDGFRLGLKYGAGAERILRALDADFLVMEATDEETRVEAALLCVRRDKELTETERWRKKEMVLRIGSLPRGSAMKSSTAAS